jgi:sec-independent protein translocase protein TatA
MNTLAFIFDGLSPGHLLIVALVLLLLFGRRLPEVGRNLGKGITEFKKGMRDVTAEPPADEQPQPPQQARAYMPPPQQTENYAPRLNAPAQRPAQVQTPVRTSRADLVD